jgi:hypothetical protein
MTDRIDGYLDGTVERAALTPGERAQADAFERAIKETRAFVHLNPPPDLTADVMRRVELLRGHPDAHALRRLAERLWTPRRVEFHVRPAYAVGAAAAVIVLMLFSTYRWRASVDTVPVVSTAAAEPRLFVQFRLEAADASNVRLAGSFTDWQPRYELHQTAPGIWTITLPLSLGLHDYAFVVDGQRWIADPYAQHVDDGFGGINSRIALLAPDVPRS